ncbi:MAG: hypothetical protein Q9210_000801 [Variospora velana]
MFALRDESNRGLRDQPGPRFWTPTYIIRRGIRSRKTAHLMGKRSAGDYDFWVPIVASFLGCAFGGFLYNLFIYTGPESPIKTSWLGLKRLVRVDLSSSSRRTKQLERNGV